MLMNPTTNPADNSIRIELDSPSMSARAFCVHQLSGLGHSACRAYPAKIPDRWLFSFDEHTTVQSDQVGNYTFEEEEGPEED